MPAGVQSRGNWPGFIGWMACSHTIKCQGGILEGRGYCLHHFRPSLLKWNILCYHRHRPANFAWKESRSMSETCTMFKFNLSCQSGEKKKTLTNWQEFLWREKKQETPKLRGNGSLFTVRRKGVGQNHRPQNSVTVWTFVTQMNSSVQCDVCS